MATYISLAFFNFPWVDTTSGKTYDAGHIAAIYDQAELDRIKASGKASTFKDFDPAAAGALAGVTSINGGALGGFRNLLINAAGNINQRAFAGGAIAEYVYAEDRWRAGGGGANWSIASETVTHVSGERQQIIENAAYGSLAGKQITVSVEDPSLDVTITIGAHGGGSGSQAGTITAGSGRRSVTLTVPATATANIYVAFGVAASTTYKRPQVEVGNVATPFERVHPAIDLIRCLRYFYRLAVGQFESFGLATSVGTDTYRGVIEMPVPLRASPTITYGGTFEDLNTGIDLTPSTFTVGVTRATIQYAAASTLSTNAITIRGIGAGLNTISFSAEL